MEDFKIITAFNLEGNPFVMLDKSWMLITAGTSGHFNAMTASWGGFGILWHKTVAYVFIRPTRYTFNFMEESETFSLSFFDEQYRGALNLFGTKSGRRTDKVKETGLIPLVLPNGAVSFREARLIMECEKMYADDLKPGSFISPSIELNYPKKDYHRMYIGEILNVYLSQHK